MATALGFSAILMWAGLALLTDLSGAVPPFQLAAMTFALGTLVGLAGLLRRGGGGLGLLRQRPAVWLLGVGGLFGYHALYFAALRAAPPAEASLVAYLWPLLIVLGSAMLPGERLRPYHFAGAALGFCGAGLVIAGRAGGLAIDPAHLPGYVLAFGCALTWTAYSLLSRRFAEVPSEAVTGFCAGTAVLSLLCHLLFEKTVWPAGPGEWAALVALGLLPVGAAFYVWDVGVKKGDIQLLGAASYAAPILSTLVLVAAGRAAPTPALGAGALLVTIGAGLAALPLFRRLLAAGKAPARS